MSVELQIRTSALEAIVVRSLQQKLRTTCFAAVGTIYVDHADVAQAPVEFTSAGAAVHVRVPVDVFAVPREAVLAAPNDIPAGATQPTRAAVVLELVVEGTVLVLRAIGVEPAGLDVTSLGVAVPFNLGPMLEQLKMPSPASSRAELAGNIVCVRFEPIGEAADRLLPDHQWGVFLDGAAVERLALAQVPQNLSSVITSMRTTAHWRPAGNTPHVDIDYEGAAQVPDPFSGRVSGTFHCDLSVVPTPAQQLRTDVSWTLSVDLGSLVPAAIDHLAELTIVATLDPSKFGGTPTGPRSFFRQSRLPDLSFMLGMVELGRFLYASGGASPDGMTIGGTLRLLLDPGRETLQMALDPFRDPRFVVYASERGCVFGWQGDGPSDDEIRSSATVDLWSCGKLCESEVLSPGDWISRYVSYDAVSDEGGSLRVQIPALTAAGITEPVRLVVRTARGVRLIDLGKPHIEFDEEGHVKNAEGSYIDDCLYADVWTLYWLMLPTDPVTGRPLPPPPKPWPPPDWESNPDWLTLPSDSEVWVNYLEGLSALHVQVVTVTRLQPGEVIEYQSFEHSAIVNADGSGRAVVPVVQAVRHGDRLEPAKLTRVSRQAGAEAAARTAVFHREASVPAGSRNRLVTAPDGEAFVLADFEDRTETYAIGFPSGWSRIENAELPQTNDATRPSLPQVDLPGLVSVFRLPGFDDEPIAFAAMDDGATLVLDLSAAGDVRVAGTFRGPMGELQTAGNWAIGTAPNRLSTFRVTRA